mgnify:CR=1 FL=1
MSDFKGGGRPSVRDVDGDGEAELEDDALDFQGGGAKAVGGINNDIRVPPGAGESGLRDALNDASAGQTVHLPAQFSETITNGTLTIPSGVKLLGPSVTQGGPVTLTKGFDGTLLEYDSNTVIAGLYIDGNRANHTGNGVAPVENAPREVVMRNVFIEECETAAFRLQSTYFSRFWNCYGLRSGYALRVAGDTDAVTNTFYSCRFGRSEVGVSIEQTHARSVYFNCRIDRNSGAGMALDSGTSSVSFALSGTAIDNNDGPGVLIDGTFNSVGLQTDMSTRITENAQNPDSGLTTPVGSIHSENGARIQGRLGHVFDDPLIRHNSDGLNGFVTILGGSASVEPDVTLPDTSLIILNDRTVGSVTALNGSGISPSNGVVSY